MRIMGVPPGSLDDERLGQELQPPGVIFFRSVTNLKAWNFTRLRATFSWNLGPSAPRLRIVVSSSPSPRPPDSRQPYPDKKQERAARNLLPCCGAFFRKSARAFAGLARYSNSANFAEFTGFHLHRLPAMP